VKTLIRYLAAALFAIWPTVSRADDPHPAAPFVELGAGVGGTLLGFAAGLPVVGICAHRDCRDAILPTMGVLGALGAGTGVTIAGGAHGRHDAFRSH
jgi:hypothetical protein